MVNTFLVSSDFRESASKLDFRRLNKQIVESHQILTLVESFHVLGKMFNDPVPSDNYKCYDWIRKIKKQYDALSHSLFLHQGEYHWYNKKRPVPKKLKYDEKFEILETGEIIYKGEKYPKFSLVLPGDNFFGKLGFYSHPAVLMFLNYPDSLKHYINSHIDEFIKQGGKSGCEKRKCKIKIPTENIIHPPWALDQKFHQNHKEALLTKEIARNEKPHYTNFPDFHEAYNFYLKKEIPTNPDSSSDFSHYIWPYSQDLENPLY